jgi:hypothetical protein
MRGVGRAQPIPGPQRHGRRVGTKNSCPLGRAWQAIPPTMFCSASEWGVQLARLRRWAGGGAAHRRMREQRNARGRGVRKPSYPLQQSCQRQFAGAWYAPDATDAVMVITCRDPVSVGRRRAAAPRILRRNPRGPRTGIVDAIADPIRRGQRPRQKARSPVGHGRRPRPRRQRLPQFGGELLDFLAGLFELLERRRIGDAEVRALPKGGSMHDGDTLGVQKLGDEVLIVLDHLA